MSKTFIIGVPQETVNYLQRLAFEVNNYRDNLAYLLDTRRNDIALMESAVFKKYQALTLERSTEYELAKTETINHLIPKEFNASDVAWTIDYKWCELQLTVSSEYNVIVAEKLGLQIAEV